MCSSCGSYNQYCTHQQQQQQMMWSSQYQYQNQNQNHDTDDYSYSFASSPNSVDCTLSLGTPSTRFSTSDLNETTKPTPHRNSVSSFCWDLFHPTKHSSSSSSASSKPNRHHSNATTSSGGDSLLARRCANCDTTSTPLWRNGPRGPKSLCNACGIRYKKEERRAAAASTTAAHNAGMMMVDPHNGSSSSWSHQYANQGTTTPHQKMQMQCFGAPSNQEFRFMEDDRGGADGGVQFLSWLTYDRPAGLVHDFTR